MNDTYGKLEDLGMEIHTIVKTDSKGRIVIPINIRKNNKQNKYFLCTFEDMIIMREV